MNTKKAFLFVFLISFIIVFIGLLFTQQIQNNNNNNINNVDNKENNNNNEESLKIEYINNNNKNININSYRSNNNNRINNRNNNNKINSDNNRNNNKINLSNDLSLKLLKINNETNNSNDNNKIKQKLPRYNNNNNNNNPFNKIDQSYKDNEQLNIERSNKIRESMKHAWYSYKEGVWGHDDLEIKNSNKSYVDWLGGYGVTIIDSLTTLYVMELEDELNDGKTWVKELLLNKSSKEVSSFEANIRYLGGLLGIYDLTGDKVYLDKATEFGDLLMYAFADEYPFPASFLNVQTKKTRNRDGQCVTLAPIGTFSLEFSRLSDLTGDPKYKQKIDRIIESLTKMGTQFNGLYPCSIQRDASRFCSDLISIGGMGDSYYEYLLKMWIYTDGEEEQYSKLFEESADSIIHHLYRETPAGFGFIGNYKSGTLLYKQEHLTCFAGGMFALAAASNITGNDKKNQIYMEVGKKVTSTCAHSYFNSPVGLGPEIFSFDSFGNITYKDLNWYLLRPETVESIFILYRLTGDIMYQDWAWKIYESIETNCRDENGYLGYRDITTGLRDTVQHSFFMAETLKYLYLTFSNSNKIPLDKYVFQTEAHPLKIKFK